MELYVRFGISRSLQSFCSVFAYRPTAWRRRIGLDIGLRPVCYGVSPQVRRWIIHRCMYCIAHAGPPVSTLTHRPRTSNRTTGTSSYRTSAGLSRVSTRQPMNTVSQPVYYRIERSTHYRPSWLAKTIVTWDSRSTVCLAFRRLHI